MHLIQMECSQSFCLSQAWVGGPGQTHRPRTPGCLHVPCNCICRMKEGSRSHCDPRIPDSSHHEQTLRDPQACPSVPIKTAAAAAEPDGAKMQAWEEPGPSQVTFPSGLRGLSVDQTMNVFNPEQYLPWGVQEGL